MKTKPMEKSDAVRRVLPQNGQHKLRTDTEGSEE